MGASYREKSGLSEKLKQTRHLMSSTYAVGNLHWLRSSQNLNHCLLHRHGIAESALPLARASLRIHLGQDISVSDPAGGQ